MNAQSKIDKVDRYNWNMQDAPGRLIEISKHDIKFDESYQRDQNKAKILSIARDWSWMAMGVITIADRGGQYYAVDGMHRVGAALLRSDIQTLPCIVFQTHEITEEAKGFVQANTLRKAVGTYDKHRALVLAKDENALFVQSLIDQSPFEVAGSSTKLNGVKCFGVLSKLAKIKRQQLFEVWPLVCEVCEGHFLNERILEGLLLIHEKSPESIVSGKWRKRILQCGFLALKGGAESASAYYARGGARVWADGMLTVINKGMRKRLEIENGIA